MTFSRSCMVCGARITEGTRCPKCAVAPRICVQCTAYAVPGTNYCTDHTWTEAQRNARFKYRKDYGGTDYRRNRAKRYQMAQGRCEACGKPLNKSWQCHHVIPLSEGGSSMVKNLRCMCESCHAALH